MAAPPHRTLTGVRRETASAYLKPQAFLQLSWFAEALGHSACRAGHHVRYVKVANSSWPCTKSRADNSFERELRAWLAPDLLILDLW